MRQKVYGGCDGGDSGDVDKDFGDNKFQKN